jgi:hypothetical protein
LEFLSGDKHVLSEQYIGSWKLASFESKTPDGRNFIDHLPNPVLKVALSALGTISPSAMPMNFRLDAPAFYPFGPTPIGHLIYTADGYYALTMSTPGRRGFGSEDVASAGLLTLRKALMSYLSSSGRYTVRGDQIIHHVEAHIYPDETGRDHPFSLEFDAQGRMVALKPTAPSALFGGKSVLTYATWARG